MAKFSGFAGDLTIGFRSHGEGLGRGGAPGVGAGSCGEASTWGVPWRGKLDAQRIRSLYASWQAVLYFSKDRPNRTLLN